MLWLNIIWIVPICFLVFEIRHDLFCMFQNIILYIYISLIIWTLHSWDISSYRKVCKIWYLILIMTCYPPQHWLYIRSRPTSQQVYFSILWKVRVFNVTWKGDRSNRVITHSRNELYVVYDHIPRKCEHLLFVGFESQSYNI